MSLFTELKRRNVFRVGLAYLLFAWVFLQGADFVLDMIGAPAWVIQALALLAAMGLPGVLIVSWVYEMTPEGLKRESEIDRETSITAHTGRKLDRAIIALLALGLIYFAWESRFADRPVEPVAPASIAAAPGPAKSIAVLPFADLSQARDQEWFADGLAEEILNALARTPDLLVSSRTSSFKYKGSVLDVSQIATDLGVAHVLEGSVRSSGDRIRVTAQLIRASDGFHVWSENYDRDIADMISIQEDLARNIAKALETTMDPAALAEMTNAGTRSVEAYQLYLRGRDTELEALNSSEGREQVNRAYDYFERARALDPKFAAAHRRAAEFWLIQLSPTRTDTGTSDLAPPDKLAEFNARVERAIESAPTETERLQYEAIMAFAALRLNDAIALYQRYLAQRPNDLQAMSDLAQIASLASRHDLERELLEHARQRAFNDSFAASWFVNDAYKVIGPAEAAEGGLELLSRWPNNDGMLYQVHRTLMWAGRYEEADRLAAQYFRLRPGPNNLIEAREACADGDRATAERILERIDPDRNDGLSERWHVLMLLDRKQEAAELLRPLEESGVPYQLASFMGYRKFDARPFPSLMAVLRREGISRPDPVEIPFKCPPPTEPSIAVLPFRDMSAARDQGYFGEGIAEELLNALVKLEGIKVASRTSTFSLADDDLDIPAIAERLGVNHILEGSVRTAGRQVRVTAQLIDVSEDTHLWSETYDGSLDDIFQIQDEITAKITAAMKVQLGSQALASAASELTGNAEAYRLYLQGRHLWRQRNAAALNKAVQLFEQAVEMDPGFSRAWSNLGVAYLILANYDPSHDIEASFRRALAAADRALALNPTSTEARIIRANFLEFHCNVVGSAGEYEAAIANDPDDPTARHWYAMVLLTAGRTQYAREQIEIARRLDPLITAITVVEALVLSSQGQSDRAIALIREAESLGFRDGAGDYEGRVLVMAGRAEEGAEHFRQTAVIEQDPERRRVLELVANAAVDPAQQPELIEFMGRAKDASPSVARDYADLLAALGSPYLFTYLEGMDCPITGQNLWMDAFRTQRGSPEFFELMERSGYVDFWRESGWPDDCASLDQTLAECPQ